MTLTSTSAWAKLRSIALKIFEYKSILILLKRYAVFVYKIKSKKFKLFSVKESGIGVYKKPTTALRITLNRKTAIDRSQPKTEYKTITTEDLYSSIFKTAQWQAIFLQTDESFLVLHKIESDWKPKTSAETRDSLSV